MDKLMQELVAVRMQLASLAGVSEDVKVMRREVQELTAVTGFMSSKFDDVTKQLLDLTKKCDEIDQVKANVASLNDVVIAMKMELNERDQLARTRNIEIKGIPIKKNENVYDIVLRIASHIDFPVTKGQIDFATRVASRESNMVKPIVVSFLNRHMREDFVTAARAKKEILTSHLGLAGAGEPKRVFVNEHLTGSNKLLLNKVKVTAKERGYQYCWVRNGRILVRKNSGAPPLRIVSEKHIVKIS